MQVLVINGSPHKDGCTYTALTEVIKQLEVHNISTRVIHVGTKPVQDCIGCMGCARKKSCVFEEDAVNEAARLMDESDGLLVGSPVYYAGPSGALCSFLNRMYFQRIATPEAFANKPAAAVVSCRRGGASAAFDRLNKYFSIARMPVVSSQYWNAVHGSTPEDVRKDLEGLQIMRTLGRNFAWMLQNIQASANTIPSPEIEPITRTNFIR